jgi:hypothetical protein
MNDELRESNRKRRIKEIPKEWLRRRITVEEVEARNLEDFDTGDDTTEVGRRRRENWLRLARKWGVAEDGKSIPFGFGYRQWRAWVATMQEGDELWEFNSGDLSWQRLAGRAGIAIVRNGEIFDCRITSLN